MKTKQMVYTILFCCWIGLNYDETFHSSCQNLIDYLEFTREPPIFLSKFQFWFFEILGIVFDSIFVAAATGIFAYHFRELKTWHYLALGLSVCYLADILTILLWHRKFIESFEMLREYYSMFPTIALVLARLILAIWAAQIGASYGLNTPYLDSTDEELGYVDGVSKKMWAFLMLIFNPVVKFSTDFSVMILYLISNDISSSTFWKKSLKSLYSVFTIDESGFGGIVGLVTRLVIIWLIWCVTCFMFYFGIQSIRKKEASYRLLKILAIFVALPAAILIIPLVRNRTWFF